MPDVANAPSKGRAYAIFALRLLAVIYLLNAMDQSILAAVASGIQAEFGLSDTQVGITIAVGVLSDLLHSLQLAFLLMAPTAMLLSAGCAAYGLRSVADDIEAMEERWASPAE